MGPATAISTAMIAITIISSMKVKPKRRREDSSRGFMSASPFAIRCSIARFIHALGIDVEHVLAAPGLRRGIITIAPEAPLIVVGHGVFGNAAQILHLLVHRSGGLDPIHQLLQALGIVVGIELRGTDLLG